MYCKVLCFDLSLWSELMLKKTNMDHLHQIMYNEKDCPAWNEAGFTPAKGGRSVSGRRKDSDGSCLHSK
jgi:hypothetical protein